MVRVLFAFGMVISLAGMTSSANAQDECFFECKEQFEAMQSYDRYTPVEEIQRVFGNPKRRASNSDFILDEYQGSQFNFYTLNRASDKALVGVSVIGGENLNLARIPFLHMSTSIDDGKPCKTSLLLGISK